VAHPKVISIDSETAGAIKGFKQTLYHPQRILYTDGIPLHELIRTVSITIPVEDPRCPIESTANSATRSTNCGPYTGDSNTSEVTTSSKITSWSGLRLVSLKQARTMVLVMKEAEHRRVLAKWLAHADTLVGTNLPFDIACLRTQKEFRHLLSGQHQIIDTQVLNSLHWENRPERSLKNLGPVFRLYKYDPEKTLANDHQFEGDWDPDHHFYVASDSWNSMLLARALAQRIIRDWPDTDKLSPFCFEMFSDCLWFAVRLAEAGIPMSRVMLEDLHRRCAATAEGATKALKELGLTIAGEGSDRSKREFIESAFRMLDDAGVAAKLGLPTMLKHHLVQFTKGGKLSITDRTRSVITLLSKELPEWIGSSSPVMGSGIPLSSPSPSPSDSPSTVADSTTLRRAIDLWDDFARAQKIMSSYTAPLLYRRRSQTKQPLDSVLIPQPETPLWVRLLSASKPQPSSNDGCSVSGTTVSGPSPSSTSPSQPTLSCTLPPSSEPSTSSSKLPAIPNASPPSTGATPPTSPLRFDRWDVWLGYPTVYVTPGPTKDTSSDWGGQRQARLSIKNPAAQTFPPEVKACERSRWGDEGCIVAMDLAQIELRVPAVLSGEPTLVTEFNTPKPDLHGKRAVYVFGDDVAAQYPFHKGPPESGWRSGDMRSDPRQWAKKLNFEDLYWAMERKMQLVMLKDSGRLFPLDFFRGIVASRPALRPVLYAWQEALLWEATRHGRLVLPFTGHSRNFEGYDYSRRKYREYDEERGKDETSEVLNFPIQTTAAVVIHRIAARVHKKMPSLAHINPPVYCYINRHDALFFDCRRERKDEVIGLISEAVTYVEKQEYWSWLTERYGHSVPLVGEIKVAA
jgi:hypothetical protein